MNEQQNLFNSLISGDSKGILEIYELIYPLVRKYIKNNSGSEEDAEDIFQKALMHITTKFKVSNSAPTSNFEWYLYGICKNMWLKELSHRKKRRNNTILKEVSDEKWAKSMAIALLENDRWELYQRNFNLLSDNCKKVLSLFLKKHKQKEIAEELGYNSETVVRQRVFKCKSKLIKLIQKDSSFKNLKDL
ncbi:MAG: RNA polymerase sigma factor [Flavobacteriaceae bacterium]